MMYQMSFLDNYLSSTWASSLTVKVGKAKMTYWDCEILSFRDNFVTIKDHRSGEEVEINGNRVTSFGANPCKRPYSEDQVVCLLSDRSKNLGRHDKTVIGTSMDEVRAKLDVYFEVTGRDPDKYVLRKIIDEPFNI